jgi:hypothetical protein
VAVVRRRISFMVILRDHFFVDDIPLEAVRNLTTSGP